MRFDLRAGFPLLTTKKLAFRWIAEELPAISVSAEVSV